MNNLALFDFDGTITNSDTLSGFLLFYVGKKRYYYTKYLRLFHQYAAYYLGLSGYEKLKRNMIKQSLKDEKFLKINMRAKEFYEEKIKNDIKKSALLTLDYHKKSGDKVVVVSASLEILLQYFCKDHGFDLIANILSFPEGICNGNINGRDCNGKEKVKRINDKYNLSEYNKIYAYGDSKFDLPMLEIADYSNYQTFK